MEGTPPNSQGPFAVLNKKRATPANTPPSSSSSSADGSGSKRQRLDTKKPAEEKSAAADFISLDFSEGEAQEDEPELTKQISKSASLGDIAEENEDADEGGVTEKISKKKRRIRGHRRKRKAEELDVQEAQDVKGQPDLAGEDISSGEEGGVKLPHTNGSDNPKDAEEEEEEEEEEDKDSFTRRALQAKMTNSKQTPREVQNEKKLETVETTAVTAPGLETDNATLSNGTSEKGTKKDKVAETEVETASRKKGEKKKRKQKKEKRAARRERRNKALLDLPKGGDFSNLSNGKQVGSDEGDDGLEINLDFGMDDLDEQEEEEEHDEIQAEVKNESADEEGEVDESPENGDEAAEDDSESSDDDDGSPYLDQIAAIKQRKYYSAFVIPPFVREEERPFFEPTQNLDFKVDLVREKKLAAPHKVKESKRVCNVCTQTGHSEDTCELLKCKHCNKLNEHFSHACPDAPIDVDEPRVKDMWRRIPAHFHTTTSPAKLRVACYHCAGKDHFGDDCPRVPPLSVPGSFSLTDINTWGYASQEWLLTFSDKLADLESGKVTVKTAPPATKETVTPATDPFKDLRKLDDDDAPPRKPPAAPKGGRGRNNRGGGDGGPRGEDSYRPDRAPRGPARPSQIYRNRSPVRSEVFDRYREAPPPPPPRQPHGLPPRPRSRSPVRPRPTGGPHGGNVYRPPADYRDRPASGGRSYGAGGGRSYESRAQPPLPNEPVPRGGGGRGGRESYRPMPSSARGNWQKYKA